MRKIWKVAVALILGLLVAVGLYLVQTLGPTLGLVYWGRPVYLLEPSLEKAGSRALDLMDQMGLYAEEADWQDQKSGFYAGLDRIESQADLQDLLQEAIGVAGGQHSHVLTFDKAEEWAKNFILPELKLDGSILYVKLPAFMGNRDQAQAYADKLVEAMDNQVKALVVDLRGNGGGDMGPMVAGLAPVLEDGVLLTMVNRYQEREVSLVDGQVTGGGTPVKVSFEKKLVDIPIAVLVDGQTGSSGEMTLVALLGEDRVETFGQASYGVPTSNTSLPINRNMFMLLTSDQVKDRTGRLYPEQPIEVMHPTEDPLGEAMEWLKAKID